LCGEEAAHGAAGLVELGFGVAQAASLDGGDFAMLEAVNIVKEEDFPVAGREGIDGALQGDAVDGAGLGDVARAEIASRIIFGDAGHHVVERDDGQNALAQPHEHDIEGHAMEPGGEERFAAKRGKLAMQLEEGFLRKVFSEGEISDHLEADIEDTLFVEEVELGEGFVVPGLGTDQDIFRIGLGRRCGTWTPQGRSGGRVEG